MTSTCEKQLVSALTVLTVLPKNGHRRCFVILVPKGTVSIGSRDIPNTHTHTHTPHRRMHTWVHIICCCGETGYVGHKQKIYKHTHTHTHTHTQTVTHTHRDSTKLLHPRQPSYNGKGGT